MGAGVGSIPPDAIVSKDGVQGMKANSRTRTFLRELRLPRAERAAARAERRAEDTLRSQRDNEHTRERRGAAIEAEPHRTYPPGGGTGGISEDRLPPNAA
jgi:hypothetical protein